MTTLVFGFEECPFCLKKMLPTQYMQTCCGHEFHIDCLQKLVLERTDNCPICREQLTLHCHQNFFDHSMCCTDLADQYRETGKTNFFKKIVRFLSFERDRVNRQNVENKNELFVSCLSSQLLNLLDILGEFNQLIYDDTLLEVASQINEQLDYSSGGSEISLSFSLHSIHEPNFYIQLYPLEDGNLDIYIQIESEFEDFMRLNGISYIRAIAFVIASEFANKYPSYWHMSFERFVL
jgi:hypothetical protein